MKVLIFIGCHEANTINEIIKHIKNGDDVFIISCDGSLGICQYNMCANPLECKFCVSNKKSTMKRYVGNYPIHYISEFICKDYIQEAETFNFDYNNIQELKGLTYHGVEIGFGAFSSLVTETRLCNPLFDNELKSYLTFTMKKEIVMTLAIEHVIETYSPDLIILHNGRFAHYKPLLGIAQMKGINYITTESIVKPDGTECPNNFFNDIPHSVSSANRNIERDWNNANPETREKIAISFYENRRNAIYAGDKIYTKDQKVGKLPKDWDRAKENIVIFNSSEDEYLSISKEYDEDRLFKTQYEALKTIFEHYKNDISKHFYVRIHPNLADVNDISHYALYLLNYSNVTIIPPKSDISTYTLMDEANKVIVFNSTTGIEAVYWGKPVIALDRCAYCDLGVTYTPKNENDLYSLIESTSLESKRNINVLKFAYFLLTVDYPPYEYVRKTVKTVKVLGHDFDVNNIFKTMGSSLLYALIMRIFHKNPIIIRSLSTFKRVPLTRDMWGFNADELDNIAKHLNRQ